MVEPLLTASSHWSVRQSPSSAVHWIPRLRKGLNLASSSKNPKRKTVVNKDAYSVFPHSSVNVYLTACRVYFYVCVLYLTLVGVNIFPKKSCLGIFIFNQCFLLLTKAKTWQKIICIRYRSNVQRREKSVWRAQPENLSEEFHMFQNCM